MSSVVITESSGANRLKTEIVVKSDSKSAGVIVAIFNGSYENGDLDFKEMIVSFCRELVKKDLIKNIPSVEKLISIGYQPILDLQYAFSQARKVNSLNLDPVKLTKKDLLEIDERIKGALPSFESLAVNV